MKEDYQKKNEAAESELSKKMFHLKTLCDVSHMLLDQGNIDSILRNFLLMMLGSFGVVEGFAFIYEEKALIPKKLVTVGIDEETGLLIEKDCHKLLDTYDYIPSLEHVNERQRLSLFPPFIDYVAIFNIAYACNGILGLGTKIVGKPYTADDTELLETLLINLAATLKNVRSTQALKSAFREVNSLNQAKNKVINHLSHELKTPLSLLKTALFLLRKPLLTTPEEKWVRTYERADRSVKRLSSIQREVQDIMQDKVFSHHRVATGLLNECSDILESIAVEQIGEGSVVEKIRNRINEIYHPDEGQAAIAFDLGDYVKVAIQKIKSKTQHRDIDFRVDVKTSQSVSIPERILSIIVAGLIKNAVENTPDEGRVDILVRDIDKGVHLSVHDFGIGVAGKHRKLIFSGFYPTQATDVYSTKNPFDFNAGGRGADLMRIKIFSERYHFKIDMTSSRCSHLPTSMDTCPGAISACEFCQNPEDCHGAGETIFTVVFPTDN